jgi:hypothetical protein
MLPCVGIRSHTVPASGVQPAHNREHDMSAALWGVIIPSALAFAGVGLTALVSRRKNNTDTQLGFIAVLQAELATTEAQARRDASRARRYEQLAWKYHQLLLRSDLEPIPAWPTGEQEKVTA